MMKPLRLGVGNERNWEIYRKERVKARDCGEGLSGWWWLENERLPSRAQLAPMPSHNRNKHKLQLALAPDPSSPGPTASGFGLVLGRSQRPSHPQ